MRRILLADRQDITRAGMQFVCQAMEDIDTKYTEDKAELMLALKECQDAVVVLDYTTFDFNDADELLIFNLRFPDVRWILFSEDLSMEFVKQLITPLCPSRAALYLPTNSRNADIAADCFQ